MLVRNFIFWLSTKRSVTDRIARRGMQKGFARRFVAGESLEEALTASEELCAQGQNVSLNHLGENVPTEAAAREDCSGYIQMVEELHAKSLSGVRPCGEFKVRGRVRSSSVLKTGQV